MGTTKLVNDIPSDQIENFHINMEPILNKKQKFWKLEELLIKQLLCAEKNYCKELLDVLWDSTSTRWI